MPDRCPISSKEKTNDTGYKNEPIQTSKNREICKKRAFFRNTFGRFFPTKQYAPTKKTRL